jgi:preprotein translocase subunit SecE
MTKSDMNAQVESADDRLDVLKLVVAALLMCAGLAGYYVFASHSLLLRVLGLVGCVLVAAVIGLRTEKGRAVWAFFHEAQIEVRRVVWPTRDETVQTTGLVIVVVVIAALVMWMLDWVLGWGIQFVIGTGS